MQLGAAVLDVLQLLLGGLRRCEVALQLIRFPLHLLALLYGLRVSGFGWSRGTSADAFAAQDSQVAFSINRHLSHVRFIQTLTEIPDDSYNANVEQRSSTFSAYWKIIA